MADTEREYRVRAPVELDSDDAEFARGFEAGQLAASLTRAVGTNRAAALSFAMGEKQAAYAESMFAIVRPSNAEMLRRICEYEGCTYEPVLSRDGDAFLITLPGPEKFAEEAGRDLAALREMDGPLGEAARHGRP